MPLNPATRSRRPSVTPLPHDISRIPHHFQIPTLGTAASALYNRTGRIPMNNAMLSEARQTANVANARHSTGPRTDEGKSLSSQNARKHGLTATQLVIAAEDREEFEELLARPQTDIQPQGALQQILFDQFVAFAWNLRRIRCMEAELTSSAESYLDILDNPDLTAKLDRLARHQTRIERSFHRSANSSLCKQTPHSHPRFPRPSCSESSRSRQKRRLQNERAPQRRRPPVGGRPTPRRCRYTGIASEPDRRVTAGLGAS